MTQRIPLDEPHRFLNWQPHRDDCLRWGQWFETTGAPYVIHRDLERGWTIYKHQWESDVRTAGAWCCGATA